MFQMLLVTKTTAAILSGSLSVISTVIDSTVDLISGAMIWWSGRAMKRRDVYKYPQGNISSGMSWVYCGGVLHGFRRIINQVPIKKYDDYMITVSRIDNR